MSLFNPLSSAFGLDIGDRSFKLIQITKYGHSLSPYHITAWGVIDIPEGVMERGEIKNMDKAVEALIKLLHTTKGKVKSHAVVSCLPEVKTFIKIIELEPNTTTEGVKKAILNEIEQNIPLPSSEIYFDWQILSNENEEKQLFSLEDKKRQEKKEISKKKKMRVLLGAAPKKLVEDYLVLLERSGLDPTALEIEAVAIGRAIISENEKTPEALGIIDIGATRSSLVIHDANALQMSVSIPISGLSITTLISQSLGVTMSEAEILKQECGLDANRCEDKIWKILLPLIDDIVEKIRNAMRFYKIGFPAGKKIEKLYLCGGGAQFREIDNVLSRKLTIKVQRGNPLININPRLPKNFLKENAIIFTTAIGLALRATQENGK